MKNENSIYIILLLLSGYLIFKNKKKKGSIIIPSINILKSYAKLNTIVYEDDYDTPIYTFNNETQIVLLDYDKDTGFYKIEYGNGVLKYGYINENNIIYK